MSAYLRYLQGHLVITISLLFIAFRDLCYEKQVIGPVV